jgi:hypothetical protein
MNFGGDWPERKTALLEQLARARLRTSTQVLRLHEHLCLLRGYPDNALVLRKTEEMLARFEARPDHKTHKARLADTGMAGTDIHYRFFWPTALWLVERWPDRLVIDWDEIDEDALSAALASVVDPLAALWLRTAKPAPSVALARLARESTDATFFVRSVSVMPGDDFTRETFYDALAPPLILRAGADTPSRTLAAYPVSKVHFQAAPPTTSRSDLRVELDRPPRAVRPVSEREGSSLIDLARSAMVTRGRDLDAFAYGDPRDVRMIDDGHGLAWVMIGMIPGRRAVFRSTYGYLTLRNGVPVGYAQADVLWKAVDFAFNTFDTFRGLDANLVLARTMAMLRHVFDAKSFTLEPYQLGEGNDEAVASGAWWFYYKAGFRPRSTRIRTLAKAELEGMKRRRGHRSSPATLVELAKDYLYFELPGGRAPRWPRLAALGSRPELANSAGSEDVKPPRPLGQHVEAFLRQSDPVAQKVWASWWPVVAHFPDVEEWNDEEIVGLFEVILAKSGRRETDYLKLFDLHPRLADALAVLSRA